MRISGGIDIAIKKYDIPQGVIKEFIRERYPMYIRLQKINPYTYKL